MLYDSDVQSSGRAGWHERVWAFVADSDDPTSLTSEITERITLDIRAADFVFLKQLALYRNATTKLEIARRKKARGEGTGKGQKARALSRKSLAEMLLRVQCDKQRELLRGAQEACGEFPPVGSKKVTPEEKRAMDAYAKRVDAWLEKHDK